MKVHNIEVEFKDESGSIYKRLFNQIEGYSHQIDQMEKTVFMNWMVFNPVS